MGEEEYSGSPKRHADQELDVNSLSQLDKKPEGIFLLYCSKTFYKIHHMRTLTISLIYEKTFETKDMPQKKILVIPLSGKYLYTACIKNVNYLMKKKTTQLKTIA